MDKTYVITYEFKLAKYPCIRVFVADADDVDEAIRLLVIMLEAELQDYKDTHALKYIRILNVVGYAGWGVYQKFEELNDQAVFEKYLENINKSLTN